MNREVTTLKKLIRIIIILIKGYYPDYEEICVYYKNFIKKDKDKEREKQRIRILYESVYNDYKSKSKNDLDYYETLIKVSIEEFDRYNMYSLYISMIILVITVVKDMYNAKVVYTTGDMNKIVVFLFILTCIIGNSVKNISKYSMYYKFLLEILNKVREDKIEEEKKLDSSKKSFLDKCIDRFKRS
jgi:hypothetical protein